MIEQWMIVLGIYVAAKVADVARSEVRHRVMSELLNEVRCDVKRINGTVTRHDEAIMLLKSHGRDRGERDGSNH